MPDLRLQSHRQRLRKVSGMWDENREAMNRKLLETMICFLATCVAVLVVAVFFRISLPDIPAGQPMQWFDFAGGALAIVAEICVAILAFRYFRKLFGTAEVRRRFRSGSCIECGYNPTGNVSGVCPECGTEV